MQGKKQSFLRRLARLGAVSVTKWRKAARWTVITGVAISLLMALVVLLSSTAVWASARGRLYTNVNAIPHRQVGLVLGCLKVLPNGRLNPFFSTRIDAGAALYRAGKVDYLLVSGDNHVKGYDEASDMKDALLAQGVPAEKVFCDYAGFRTFDSIVRVKEVFGQDEVTVVSQKFHNQRAIFIANREGVDAIGFNAGEVAIRSGLRTKCREQLARVKTLLDVYALGTRPHFLGEKVAIGDIPQPPNTAGR